VRPKVTLVAIFAILSALVTASPAALAQETRAQETPAPASHVLAPSPLIVGGALLFGLSWTASSSVSLGASIRHWNQCTDAQNAANAANSRVTSLSTDLTALSANINAIAVCDTQPASASLWIPVAGPWVTLSNGSWNGLQQAALVADGVAQAAGLAVLAWGLLEGPLASHPSTPTDAPAIEVRPGAQSSPAGLTVIGRF
jgi:hypothetical protein